jgi:hypothetical protein
LIFTLAVKMMHVKILIPFSLGVPHDGDFQSLDPFKWDTTDPPASSEYFTRVVKPILTA